MAAAYDESEDYYHPPERSPRQPRRKSWQPRLGPIGTEVLMNRTSSTKFLYGERGSLKTGICLQDLVAHCYQDFEPGKLTPLAVICVIVRSAATEGGAWEKLNSLYLPEWYDGIGLEFTEPKMDDQKNRYLFIGNKAGTWSRIVLKSIPYGENIRDRLKGPEFSYFFFDELTQAEVPDYYLLPLQQLRRPTGGPRQFVAAGNPADEGEDHWTWQALVQKPAEAAGLEGPIIPKGGGRLGLGAGNDDIAVYHVPVSENVYWTQQDRDENTKKIMAEVRLDPTAEDRLLKGIWTPRPKGEGLFLHQFIPVRHEIGEAKKNLGLRPVPGFPIVLGYDLGSV